MEITILSRVLPTILLSLLSISAFAQNSPTILKDITYDDKDLAQKLDVYLAKSDKPVPAMIHIHGGGWRGGSKDGIPGWLAKAVNDGWLTVISVEYRFTNVAPHPAQTNDCLRAIQFVRMNAEKWNIDANRIGVTGGSAGGHLSLYVALHDDVADAKSSDQVQQQSSRVACAVSFAGPTDWDLLGEMEHKHPAYRQLIGYEPGMSPSKAHESNRSMLGRMVEMFSLQYDIDIASSASTTFKRRDLRRAFEADESY